MPFSMTYTGVAVFVIGYIFKLVGVPYADADISTTISVIVSFVGAVVTLYGRYRAGGISIFGSKK